jgi:phosphohistidine phosphatase
MTTTTGEAGALLLMRHAKSAWPDVPDHERPLARRGRRDAPAMGHWLRTAGYQPDLVLCSTARRARQTWKLARTALGADPPAIFDRRIYEASAEQVLDVIRTASPAARTLVVVGHDPGIPGLALALAAEAPRALPDRMRAKFPTGAVAVFTCRGSWDQLGPELARLACFVTPRDLSEPAAPGSVR